MTALMAFANIYMFAAVSMITLRSSPDDGFAMIGLFRTPKRRTPPCLPGRRSHFWPKSRSRGLLLFARPDRFKKLFASTEAQSQKVAMVVLCQIRFHLGCGHRQRLRVDVSIG